MDTFDSRLKEFLPDFKPEVIEPYRTCEITSLNKNASEGGEDFSSLTLQVVAGYVAFHPGMGGHGPPSQSGPPVETLGYDSDGYITLTTNFLLSVCIGVSPAANGHKIVLYDHATKDLKILGCIPKHNFKRYMDQHVVASVSDNHSYAVVLAHSGNLVTLNIFDIKKATCLLARKCPKKDFLGGSTEVADVSMSTQDLVQGRHRIAVLTGEEGDEMELRVCDPTTFNERFVQLKRFFRIRPMDGLRKTFVKYSPDGRFLFVLGAIIYVFRSGCLMLDAVLLEPLHVFPYNVQEPYKCILAPIFPAFTNCESKFVLYKWTFGDYHTPRFQFFNMPSRKMQSLKEMCRYYILEWMIADSKLRELPLSNDLINYLTESAPAVRHIEAIQKSASPCSVM